MWFLAVVPFTAGLTATLGAVDWEALTARRPAATTCSGWFEGTGLAGAIVYGGLTVSWLVLSIVVFYPMFQAMVLRWWASGLRFGDVRGDVAPAHRADLRRLCPLPLVRFAVLAGRAA